METITQKVWSRVKGQKRGTKKKLESHVGTWKADKMERKRKETKCEKERTRSTIGRKEERQKVGQSVSLPRSALKREEEGSFFSDSSILSPAQPTHISFSIDYYNRWPFDLFPRDLLACRYQLPFKQIYQAITTHYNSASRSSQ